jgi:hypothetical protein
MGVEFGIGDEIDTAISYWLGNLEPSSQKLCDKVPSPQHFYNLWVHEAF